jgi:hypothetical protein
VPPSEHDGKASMSPSQRKGPHSIHRIRGTLL